MRQAISTKFLGATNVRGSRVRVSAEAGAITVPWDHALDVERNHAEAARALAQKLGWDGFWYGGGLHNAGYCFVVLHPAPDSIPQLPIADFVIPREP